MGLGSMLTHSLREQAGAAIPRVVMAIPVLGGEEVNGEIRREMATRRRFESASPVQ